jgi:hypothetical protein
MKMNKLSKYKALKEIIDSNLPERFQFEIDHLLTSLIEKDVFLDRWITNSTMVQEGKAYFIPDDKLYKAIIILRLFAENQIKVGELSEKTISELHYVIQSLKEAQEKIRKQPELFLFDTNTISSDIDKLINIFIQQLEDKSKTYRNQQLIKEPVAESKVNEFKAMIQKQWEESRILSKVFEFYNAVTYNPEEKLQWVGLHKIQFKGAKIMFVQQNYQMIYGIEWGRQVSSEVTRFFLERVRENKDIIQIETDTYIEAFEEIIKSNSEINIAFISFSTSFIVIRPLSESGHFTHYIGSELSSFSFPALGIYKEKLIIVPLRNRTMTDGIVSLKMPGSVLMKRKTNESWIDGKLQLDIKEITDENVKRVILDSNPNADISNPKVLEEAKTGILIELDELIEFQIVEPKNIIIATVHEKVD